VAKRLPKGEPQRVGYPPLVTNELVWAGVHVALQGTTLCRGTRRRSIKHTLGACGQNAPRSCHPAAARSGVLPTVRALKETCACTAAGTLYPHSVQAQGHLLPSLGHPLRTLCPSAPSTLTLSKRRGEAGELKPAVFLWTTPTMLQESNVENSGGRVYACMASIHA